MKKLKKSQVTSLLLACLVTSGLMVQSQLFSQAENAGQSTGRIKAGAATPIVNYNGPGNLLSNQLYFDAGEDAIVCIEDGSYQLNGTNTYSGSILWTTSGDGEFTDPTNLNSTYIPGDYDTSSGMVTLYLHLDAPNLDSHPIIDALVLSFVSCIDPLINTKEF